MALDVAGADVVFVKRQDGLLDALGLRPLVERLPAREVFSAMQGDKKARRGVVRMVLADAPGVWHCGPVEDNVVLAHLESWAQTKGGDAR